MTNSHLRKKELLSSYSIQSIMREVEKETQGRNLEIRTVEEAREECC